MEKSEFWKEIKRVVAPDGLRLWMLSAKFFEDTRKHLFDPGGFYDISTIASFQEFKKLFGHVKGEERFEVYGDILARMIKFLKEDGKKVKGRFFMFDDADVLAYIDSARGAGMITDEQEESFCEAELNVGPFKGRRWAELRSGIALLTYPYRHQIVKTMIFWGTITNYIKTLFSYIFGEELKGRR